MRHGTQPDASPYDHAAFMENFCGLVDLARDSARVFSGLAPKMLAAIETAVAHGDAREIEVAAHTLKGAVSNFFAYPTRELAYRLEEIGRKGDLREAEEVFAALKQEVARLRAALLEAFPAAGVA